MMVVHPDIQQRAQAEIDRIVGEDRIPDMIDFETLSYVNCIVQELLRFNPPVPLVPHSPTEDDTYNDYAIPKGTRFYVLPYPLS